MKKLSKTTSLQLHHRRGTPVRNLPFPDDTSKSSIPILKVTPSIRIPSWGLYSVRTALSISSPPHRCLDSHAMLSVPSKPWSEDIRADAIRQDSLTESLGRILGNGDQEELKEIERALLVFKDVKEDPILLSDILANDVFSYVEDALLRECNCLCLSKSDNADMNRHNSYTHQDCLLPSNQPFFINNPDLVQRGVSQSWQQQHHVVPFTLPSAPKRSDCYPESLCHAAPTG
ncbi:uncharacterized protein LOC130545735 [Triplophysa rosa]|uniref:uncharacterized protein LOC130545735 n=1 Tax=Triplophysa rosa TaxID=992332 RepID=UPI0025461739|nr:uncharacterized protein LOC130545735 [Triplophysa rosa]